MDKDDWRGKLQRYADAHRIKGYPENFQSWVNDNADKIADARRRGTEPYFIRNNAAAIADILNPQKQPSPLEIAKQRHASRTPEDVERVQTAWAQRQSSNALIEHLQKYGDFEYHYGGKLDEASAYKHWERLTTEQQLNVLAKGKFTGMLSTEDDLDFCNIYCITDKRRMTDTLQEVLMNVKEGYNMEDDNHYVFHFKNGKQILFTEDLGKPLSKRDLERLDWLCANGGLSNFRYWFADEKAKAQMMQYMGFVEYEDGRVIASWNGKDYLGNNLHQLRESKFDKSMKQLRKELVRQERERLLIVNSKGVVIKRVMGDTRSVSFDDSIADIAKNNWVTHNHPTGKGESGIKRFGYSLSIDDIGEAIKCDMRGIIAESPYYRYKIERPRNGWIVDLDVIRKRYSEIYKEIISEYQSSFSYHENLSIIIQHLTLKRLANEFGFLYEYMKL